MKNRILLLLMTLQPLIASIETYAHDIEVPNTEGETIFYRRISNTELEVTYKGNKYNSYDNEYSGDIIIPSTVEYNGKIYDVVSIGVAAFLNCTSLTSVIIPNGITSIDEAAFQGCSSLTSITIPNSVTSISQSVFANCIKLTSVTIPNSVSMIKGEAFRDCSSLNSISIPNSVTSIGYYAFEGTAWLNNQPDGLVYAGKVLYQYKGTMPENTSVVLDDGTLGITQNAFEGRSGLSSITIPNSVTFIGDGSFKGTAWLNNQPDGLVYAGKVLYQYKGTMPDNTKIVLDDGTLSISPNAFSECRGLTSITIPSSLVSIGDFAFSNCNNLTSVSIPNGVNYIGEAAFGWCSSLTSVVIPNSITSLSFSTFTGCSSLASVTIPNSVSSIGGYAFEGCRSLASVTIPNSVNFIGESAFLGCSSLAFVTISDGVSIIGNSAFYGCSSLSFLDIPNSVISIGNGAFCDCKSLSSINISNSMTYIEEHTFNGCRSLTTVDIPNGVESIGDNAFKNCSGLTSVNIGENVASIGSSAFYGCNNIKSVYIMDLSVWCKYFTVSTPNPIFSSNHHLYLNNVEIKNLTIPENITSLGNYVFSGCGYITSVTIPNNVTTIGESAFENCYSMRTLKLPDELQIIKKTAFKGCSSLSSVTIPAYVEFIYQEAFANCNALEGVISLTKTPPFLYDNSFSNFSIPLKVPKGCKKAYQKAQGWKNFTNIIDADKYKLTYMVDGEEYKSFEIEEGETITPIAEPTKKGYTFSGWSDLPETMPAKDVTVTGTFTINKYKVTYMIDGEVYQTVEVEYGSTITPPNPGDREGYDFAWGDYPSTMPAEDITINGTYTATDIRAILADESDVKIYTVSGKPLNNLQKGVNILRYKDGRTQKLIIK